MSSSGFVPFPSSKRDENEYGPSNAPLPSFMFPLPSFSVPSQTADPVRVAMFYLLLFVANYDSRQTRLGAIDFSLITLDRESQAASGASRVGQRGLVVL